jgi:hypothetical protein
MASIEEKKPSARPVTILVPSASDGYVDIELGRGEVMYLQSATLELDGCWDEGGDRYNHTTRKSTLYTWRVSAPTTAATYNGQHHTVVTPPNESGRVLCLDDQLQFGPEGTEDHDCVIKQVVIGRGPSDSQGDDSKLPDWKLDLTCDINICLEPVVTSGGPTAVSFKCEDTGREPFGSTWHIFGWVGHRDAIPQLQA